MMDDDPMFPAIMSPELMPIPISSCGRPSDAQRMFRAPSSSTISHAARTACSAWLSSSSGAPKSAITMSPTNLSTVPLWRNTTSTIFAKYSFS